METFYDIETGDLKELWDTDLDPGMQDALKLSGDTDMHDWFLERDVKLPQVILHDKLMTDAVLGTLPIKTEHSYSLNSDGDSMPDSPGSLQNKMDDMDDDCYPVISMNSATNMNRLHNNHHLLSHHLGHHHNNNNNNNNTNNNNNINNNTNNNNLNNNNINIINQNNINMMNSYQNICSPNDDGGSISSNNSDVDIDDSNIKEEPLSPGSSCPSSPNGSAHFMNMNLANMAAYTNTDLVFEHKNGSLQLSPASQSLLKNQQITLGSTTSSATTQQQQQQQRLVMPKLNIKMEPQNSAFGLPPTPPSSLPSDESEGNQSPEQRLSPTLASAQTTTVTTTSSSSTSSRRTSAMSSNSHMSSSSSSSSNARIYNGTSTRQPIHTPLISSQPKGSTGTLLLTEEEKRTLLAEGYPIPTRLPLTKAEEKSLKKIRRKIKNKISAQESRRKKKEYMDQLERKVEILVSENSNYKKRVDNLEESNENLMNQLSKLQSLLNRQNSKFNKS